MKTKKILLSSLAMMSLMIFTGSVLAFGNGQGQGGQNANFEKPDNWLELTQEERQDFLQNLGIEAGGNKLQNTTRPENFENMTDEEKALFRETKQAKRPGESTGQGENTKNQSRNRFIKNAKKAKNYKKFTGQLKTKRNFSDKGEIKNLEAVEFLQQRGILDGYADGSFKPENPINRAESLKVLLESLGESPDTLADSGFSDVPSDAWFAGYVSKAKRKGIINGYEDGTFQPGQTVNQVELLKIAFESFGINLENYPVTSVSDVNAWYAPYLQYALDNNLLDEEDVSLSEGMTREGFSEVIYRLIQQQEAL